MSSTDTAIRGAARRGTLAAMDLVYFGSGAFGLPTIRALAEGHRIAAVVTQPDRPAGRGGTLTPTPVARWAAEHLPQTPLLKPERVNEAAIVDELRGARPGGFVVIAFGQKLGRALLDGMFAINLHASLLPRWRGAAPINAAILAGDPFTGNSVIALADRMDAGMVLGQSRRAVDPGITAGELHDALAADGPALVLDVLDRHGQGTLDPEPQDESAVTLAPKLSKEDGWVDFGDTAENCRRRVHGLTPWPGVTVQLRGQSIKLLRVQPDALISDDAPGTILDAESGRVACRDSSLRVLRVHPAGGRAMDWTEFARGRRVERGERLSGGRACQG